MKTYGSRAFAVAAPDLWNSLPDNIRSCDNLSTFKLLLRLIFLGKLITVNMAIFISVLIHSLFYYLFNWFVNVNFYLMVSNVV